MRPIYIIYKAGVTKSELSRLTGFSRVTLNRWLEGKDKPRRQVNRVYFGGIIDALETSTHEKKLPLPEGLSSAERDRRIKAAVREHFDVDSLDLLIA